MLFSILVVVVNTDDLPPHFSSPIIDIKATCFLQVQTFFSPTRQLTRGNLNLSSFHLPRNLFSSATSHRTHLAIEQCVLVPPHLRVNVVEVPLKALTLQALPQRHPLRDVSVIDTVVLQGHRESLGRGSLCFARNSHRRLVVTISTGPGSAKHKRQRKKRNPEEKTQQNQRNTSKL